MSDTHTNGSQFITETGASSTGNGDGEWQEIRSQRKGGSSSESGDSRASKSTVPTRVIVVPSGQAPGAVSWVRKYWKGPKMEAHLRGWNDKGRKTSKILLMGAEADKCGEVLTKVKNWSLKGKVPLAPTLRIATCSCAPFVPDREALSRQGRPPFNFTGKAG